MSAVPKTIVTPPGQREEKVVKTHLLCATALIAALAGPAFAQDSDTINVQSKVTPRCSALPTASASLDLGELINGQGFLVTTFAGASSVDLGSYWCNGPAKITLATTPLMAAGIPIVADAGSFSNRVDYTARFDWDDVSNEKSSTDADAEITTLEANTGTLSISVSNPVIDGGRRPVAAHYDGSVTLTVALQP